MKNEAVRMYIIDIFILMVILTVCIYIGDTTSDNDRHAYINGVNVAFTSVGTDATQFNVSLYQNGNLISTTQNGNVYDTGWSNALFMDRVRVYSREPYTYVVNANGNFSISSDGEDLSIYADLL